MTLYIASTAEGAEVICVSDSRERAEEEVKKAGRNCCIAETGALKLTREGLRTISYEYECLCMEDTVRGNLTAKYGDLTSCPGFEDALQKVVDESMELVYKHDMCETEAASTAIEEAAGQFEAMEQEGKPTYRQELLVPVSVLEQINRHLNATREEDFQSEDDTISYTAVFPDGAQMDVKCCGAQEEASWTEAVLFNSRGAELTCTEPSDEYTGTWELEYNGVKYIAVVRPEDASQAE